MFFNSKEERIKDFKELWKNYTDEDADSLVVNNLPLMEYLENEGFFTSPASTKYHGTYEGGLYDHSRCVFDRLANLTHDNNLKWQRQESPFIVGMFHDLCKCDQYKFVPNEYEGEPGHYEYNKNTLLKGHGEKSVMILSRFINLTEEEMLCIRYHMGAYMTEEWEEFDKAIRRYQTCLWTHLADQLASKVDDI